MFCVFLIIMKKKFFEEINDLFQNVKFNKMNSKMLMASLSAIVLSSCENNGNGKNSEEDEQTKASQYNKFKKEHGDLVDALREAFKNKEYNGKKGDKAVVDYINSLSKDELKNLSKFSKKELETKLNSLKNGNDFNVSKFRESLSKPSNKNANDKNANGNEDAVKQVNTVDPNSAENLKENEGKKKEEEEKKLLADIEKILNNLSKGNEEAKKKIIEYFKFLSEIGEQSIEKSFIEEYNKKVDGAESEENVISQLKQTLNNVFSNENQKKDLFNKLSEKVKKYVTDKLEDEVKKKVNVKVTSAKKDDNIETTILYSEKANDKNVINDNKQFYVIEEVEVTNSKTNKVEKIKIVVANSNEDNTLEKYEMPELNNLVVDKKEKLKEVIESYGKKLINDEPVDISKFTGLNLKDLLSKVSDFYKKLIEGKDGDDKMIIENFDKKQWIQVFNNKEDEFKKFIIKESVAIIKEYYKDLPEGTEKDKLDTCSKILFGEVLNYYDKSKDFVSIENFYSSIATNKKKYDVSQYQGKSTNADDYLIGQYIPMTIYASADKNLENEMNVAITNPSNVSLFCLFNYELNKQYCKIFGASFSNGGIVISTKGKSDGVNEGDNKDFISTKFNKFRKVEDLGGMVCSGCRNITYSGTSKNFRDGMDEALDASFKSLQFVESNGSAKNLRTLFFQYLDQMTPQQMDSITDDSFVKWMNQNNIYMSVDSMNLDCINKFCDIFFDKFFGGKEKVKAFMDAIKNETNVSGFDKTDKDKVNTAITNIQNSQKEYLDSLKNGEYTKYWYGLLTDTVLKAKS